MDSAKVGTLSAHSYPTSSLESRMCWL
jgi:hypothetical protein